MGNMASTVTKQDQMMSIKRLHLMLKPKHPNSSLTTAATSARKTLQKLMMSSVTVRTSLNSSDTSQNPMLISRRKSYLDTHHSREERLSSKGTTRPFSIFQVRRQHSKTSS